MSEPLTMKPFDKVTDEELRNFAETFLVLDTAACKTRADFVGLIQQTWRNDMIPVPAAVGANEDQDEDAAPVPRQEIPLFNKYKDPRWLVIITSTNLPGGEEPVPLGCNGDIVVVNRDAEVLIPHRFMDSLRNAIRFTLTQDTKTQEVKEAKFTAYPFQILERPSKAEIDAFRAESAAVTLGGQVARAA